MVTRDLIFLLSGTLAAMIITWIIIIRKFLNFINEEIDHNDQYRKNAVNDYQIANTKKEVTDEQKENLSNDDFTF